jgi:hypothetical protein
MFDPFNRSLNSSTKFEENSQIFDVVRFVWLIFLKEGDISISNCFTNWYVVS